MVGPDGAEVGRVEMPPDLELLEIASDAILGLHRNELDVEFVRVHPLTRN